MQRISSTLSLGKKKYFRNISNKNVDKRFVMQINMFEKKLVPLLFILKFFCSYFRNSLCWNVWLHSTTAFNPRLGPDFLNVASSASVKLVGLG